MTDESKGIGPTLAPLSKLSDRIMTRNLLRKSSQNDKTIDVGLRSATSNTSSAERSERILFLKNFNNQISHYYSLQNRAANSDKVVKDEKEATKLAGEISNALRQNQGDFQIDPLSIHRLDSERVTRLVGE